MKLHKALKLRKKLVGEITNLKTQISSKNSYMEGSLNPEKYNVEVLYKELLEKINSLVALKFVINEANKEIQAQIYNLSEYKALITFWSNVSTTEGSQTSGRFGDSLIHEFKVQIDEIEKNRIIKEFQTKVDAIQEEIDTYNYTTEIPWENE